MTTKNLFNGRTVISREELANLLLAQRDQRPLIVHMIEAIKAHDGVGPHRCRTSGCAQVVEFKAVLMAAIKHWQARSNWSN